MSSDEDVRINCKYGANCYQKNKLHLDKYKHPSKKRQISPAKHDTPKKQKPNAVVLNEDLSDSDDEMFLQIPLDDTPEARREDISNADDRKVQKEVISDSDYEIENSSEEEVAKEKKEEAPKDLQPFLDLEEKKAFIKEKFLVDMPTDFYDFWDLCKHLNKNYPKNAFNSVGLILVGPYDILDDSFQYRIENDKLVLHWRYFYDPPEFQTIIKGNDFTGFHLGYFRDSPDKPPAFVGSIHAKKDCTIEQMGDNIFGAINTYLDSLLKTADPFKKMSITKLQNAVKAKAIDMDYDLTKCTTKMQTRTRKQVCKTFHNAGIIVPYDRTTTIGYRKLPVDYKELRKLLDRVSTAFPDIGNIAFASLQPILTAATIANDECDFGTSLELGINIFCYGNTCFNNTILRLLKTTYMLLQRKQFADICELHLQNRCKDKPYVIDFN